MGLNKIKCPECNAGLKSAAGFTPGKTICCPKCETYFTVEEPEEETDEEEEKPSKDKEKTAPAGKKPVKAAVADDDEEKPEKPEEDEKPKKKKKKKKAAADDEEERSYKKSPLRFIILGVLLLILVVGAVMLVQKRRSEAAADKARDEADAAEKARQEKEDLAAPIIPKKNNPPKTEPKKNEPKKNEPKGTGQKTNDPKQGNKGVNAGGFAVDALGGVLSGGAVPPAEAQVLTQVYTAALVGAWVADLGGGVTEALTYNADGTFTASRTGSSPATSAGKYTVKNLVGSRGLRVQLDSTAGARTVTAVFEDDELQHPSLQPGVTAIFRKKK